MNKFCIVKIRKKSIARIAVSPIILAGMMILVFPVRDDKADARINAKATSLICPFSDVKVELIKGKFWRSPSQPLPNVVTWETWGGQFPVSGGSSETGRFSAFVGGGGDQISVNSANPLPGSGPNSCNPSHHFLFTVTCRISSDNSASLTITVSPPPSPGE